MSNDRNQMIKAAADNFCGWSLPNDFSPDGGISFTRLTTPPCGTNLFTAEQARQMFEYCLPHESSQPQVQVEPIESENGDSMSDHLHGILESGTKCPLCAKTGVHEHTPMEIIIYRNGMKYGRRNAHPQSTMNY